MKRDSERVSETRGLPSVVMVVANSVTVDPRVQKSAEALVRAGWQVTVLGLAKAGLPESEHRPGGPLVRRLVVNVVLSARDEPASPKQRIAMHRAARKLSRLRRAAGDEDRAITSHSSRNRARTDGVAERAALVEADMELSFGPAIEALRPEVVHVHDIHLLGVAARAVARLRHRGLNTHLVYDAHEYVAGLPTHDEEMLEHYVGLEAASIRAADLVITVSPLLADRLRSRYALEQCPTVVMNVPAYARSGDEPVPPIREAVGLPDDVPLLVYSGGLHPTRGIEGMIDALPLVPGAHLVLIASERNRQSGYARQLEERATRLDCRERFHLAPYVAPEAVPRYLTGATIGLNPLLHHGNYEVALPNKLFDYVKAGLPVVNSDVEASAQFVRSLGVGAVYPAGDVEQLGRAINDVLSRLDEFRRRLLQPGLLDTYSWSRQESALIAAYDGLGDADSLGSGRQTGRLTAGCRRSKPS
jgi:glycosyltransferase involved in cell wall biosynthesis